MKFKLDENIDPRAAPILHAAGHDALTAAQEGLAGQPDPEVAAAALREERCLVTLDLGFGNVLAHPPQRSAGIVVLRHPRPTAARLLLLVRQLVSVLGQHNPHGRLWIVEPGRVRVHGDGGQEDVG